MRTPLASALFTDVDVWDLVELELQIPMLVIGVKAGLDAKVARTFFAQPRHLEQLLAAGTPIGSVDLLSPAHMNGADRWMLEPLVKLWRCVEPSVEQFEWLYQVRDGREYCQSVLGTAPCALRKRDCVFSNPGLQSQTACS